MTPPPGRLGSVVKLPVQVRMFPEEIEAVDAFAAELSQQSYGAAFTNQWSYSQNIRWCSNLVDGPRKWPVSSNGPENWNKSVIRRVFARLWGQNQPVFPTL